MRIALFVGGFPTLTETWLIDQVAGLVERGHEVTVFADPTDGSAGGAGVHPAVAQHDLMKRVRHRPTRHDGWSKRVLSTAMVAIMNMPRHPRAMIGAINVLKYGWRAASGDLVRLSVPMLGRERFDVVHAHHGDVGYVAAILKRWGLIRDPLLTSFHGPDLTDAVLMRRSNGYDELIRMGDRFTTGSAYMRGVATSIGFAAEKIEVLPQGIRPERFAFRPRSIGADGAVRMLSIARLAPVKGIEFAIRAMAILRERLPKLEYVIVGDGPLRAQLEALIKELKLEDCVRITGMLTADKLAPVLAESHFLVMPGVKLEDGQVEGQGLVLLEAQACGMPVIATRAGGMPEMLREGETGLLCEPRSVESLAEAIVGLIDRAGDWPRMGQAGRTIVEEQFGVARQLDRLVALYAEVAKSGVRA